MLSDSLKEIKSLADELFSEVETEELPEEETAILQGILDEIGILVEEGLKILSE